MKRAYLVDYSKQSRYSKNEFPPVKTRGKFFVYPGVKGDEEFSIKEKYLLFINKYLLYLINNCKTNQNV